MVKGGADQAHRPGHVRKDLIPKKPDGTGGDSKAFIGLLGGMARQRGVSRVAPETGLAREALYRALSSDGNPEFATIVKVTTALGLQLSAARRAEESSGPK